MKDGLRGSESTWHTGSHGAPASPSSPSTSGARHRWPSATTWCGGASSSTPPSARWPSARLGVDGDEQADRVNHGGPYKAVYAYASEDAAFWAAEHRPPHRAGHLRREPDAGRRRRHRCADRRALAHRVGAAAGVRAARAVLEARRAAGRPALPPPVRRRRAPRRLPLGPQPGILQAGDEVLVVDRPDHGVSVGLVYEVALRAPWRLPELEPARPT